MADHPRLQLGRRCRDSKVRCVSIELDRLTVDGSIAEHRNNQRVTRGQADDLHRAHRRQFGARPDDHRSMLGDLSEQVGRLMKQFFETAVGMIEERTDALRSRRVEATGGRDVVDEKPISLVGRHAAGGGVRLREVALLLEHRHLVANRGRTDPHTRQVGDMGRAHRLRRRDVLLHDGSEDGGLAFVEHLALQVSEC